MTTHRLLSHRSWQAPRWFEFLGSVAATLGLTGSPISWVALHRQHHRYPDKNQDPHSPRHNGIFALYFLPIFYRPNLRLSKDLLDVSYQKWLHRNFLFLNIGFDLVLLAINPVLVLSVHWLPAFALWFVSWSINAFGHLSGYRNFELPDDSRNNLILNFFVFGEGLHNNHHRYPNRSGFRVRPFEMDISGWCIRLLDKRGA